MSPPTSSYPRSPASPNASNAAPQQERGVRRDYATAEDVKSNGQTSRQSSYGASGSMDDPFSSQDSPTSPGASTASASGSPRSFYTPAMGTLSDTASTLRGSHYHEVESIDDRQYNPRDEEDDLGDRTIVVTEPTPQRRRHSPDKGKGPARGSYHTAYHHAPTGSVSSITSDSVFDDRNEEDTDDSKRIEDNLRRWAKKEQLRRAQTRNRQSTVVAAPPAPAIMTDGIAAVSDLARRMSSVRKPGVSSMSATRRPVKRASDSDASPFQEEAEEVELQIQIPRNNMSHPQRSSSDPLYAANFVHSPVSPPPLSATSIAFPERAERAARTGSRFIEDLEDQEVQSGTIQSYADLQSSNNPFATPLTSPTKTSAPAPGSTAKNKFRIRLGGGHRTDSFTSISSLQSFDSKDTVTGPSLSQLTPRGNSDYMLDPHASSTPRQEYFPQDDESRMRLVRSPRQSTDYRPQADQDDQDERFEKEKRQVSWWEYILCCGCFGSGVHLEDDDEQAGRTFPE